MRFCKPVPACGLQFWSFQVTSDSLGVCSCGTAIRNLFTICRETIFKLDPRHYSIHEQSMNHSSVKKKESRPRCYVKSPTAQDVFLAIPVLISCAGVTRRWGLLSHAHAAVIRLKHA